MSLRKTVDKMDDKLVIAFQDVADDLNTMMFNFKQLSGRINKIEKVLSGMIKDKKRFTKVGPVTGKTYTTLNGRVHAIAQHLGLEFAVTPKEVIVNKAKVSAVKAVKKGKK